MVERKTLNLVVVGSIPIEGAFLFASVFFQYINMWFLRCEHALVSQRVPKIYFIEMTFYQD